MDYINRLFLAIVFFIISLAVVSAQEFDGFALYNDGNTAFLIDKNGDIAHRYNCNARGNYASFLKSNGNLVRGAVHSGNQINGAAVGGKVQEYTPSGELVWEFVYSTSSYVSHHDLTAMPNGGVLLIAWEAPELDELKALGYEGNTIKYPTHFVEIQQDGSGGKIVWEWHMKDHFVQDIDPTLANYGVISENPQLMNINVEIDDAGGGPPGSDRDWFHVNGIDYNEEFDQIVFSSRFLSEIFIIDHSTTTAEAAGHTGGNSGRGGDFLWRWGNPSNYGTIGNRNISAAVHDCRFITNDGRQNSGYLHIFNNEGTSGSSQIDGMILPRDGFNFAKEAGKEYGPAAPDWTHRCRDTADGQSASDKLPNGNTFVNLSRNYMYEVDKDDNLVWQYAEGPPKAFRYVCAHPGIQELIDLGFIDGALCATSANEEVYNNPFSVAPNPSTGIFNLSGLDESLIVEKVLVRNDKGELVKTIQDNFLSIDIENNTAGTYFMTVHFTNGYEATKRIILTK